MKKEPIELTVYIITGLFLFYLFYVCFIAEPDRFLFGNVFIKAKPIDFGGFGALLSGIFAPLAFLWIILNFKQQNKNLHLVEKNLKISIESYESQRAQQNSEYNIQIINTYITALQYRFQNFRKDDSPFQLNREFIKKVYDEYTRLYIINPNSTQATMMYCALSEFKISFENEITILRSIENQILEEKDRIKRHNLLTLLQINIDPDLLIIMRFSSIGMDFKSQGYENYIEYLFKNDLLRLTREFIEANDRAKQNTPTNGEG